MIWSGYDNKGCIEGSDCGYEPDTAHDRMYESLLSAQRATIVGLKQQNKALVVALQEISTATFGTKTYAKRLVKVCNLARKALEAHEDVTKDVVKDATKDTTPTTATPTAVPFLDPAKVAQAQSVLTEMPVSVGVVQSYLSKEYARSVKELVDDTSYSSGTVKRAIRRLVAIGAAVRVIGAQRRPKYIRTNAPVLAPVQTTAAPMVTPGHALDEPILKAMRNATHNEVHFLDIALDLHMSKDYRALHDTLQRLVSEKRLDEVAIDWYKLPVS